ncbi:hypothetical protein [Klebsiella phage 05F01]|nr:hypothetical protein [Klebsiella phage 05F01]
MNNLFDTGQYVASFAVKGMSEEQLLFARKLLQGVAAIYFPQGADDTMWCISFIVVSGETQLVLIIDKDYYDDFVDNNQNLEYSLFEAQPAIIEETH